MTVNEVKKTSSEKYFFDRRVECVRHDAFRRSLGSGKAAI